MYEFILSPIFSFLGKLILNIKYKSEVEVYKILDKKYESKFENVVLFNLLNLTASLFILLLIIFLLVSVYALIFK